MLAEMPCSAFSCFLGKLRFLSWLQSLKANSDLYSLPQLTLSMGEDTVKELISKLG